MNKAITQGLVLMPPPFSAGLGLWSREDGRPGQESYAGQPNAAFVPAGQDFAAGDGLIAAAVRLAAAHLGLAAAGGYRALPVVRRALDLTRLAEIAAAQRSWVRNHTDWGAPGSSRRARQVSPTRWEQFR